MATSNLPVEIDVNTVAVLGFAKRSGPYVIEQWSKRDGTTYRILPDNKHIHDARTVASQEKRNER